MPYPAYRSSVFTLEPSVYLTDKFNVGREDISEYVTDIAIDGDIDRGASKLRCDITTYDEVIADSDWIAPYLTYTPEVGEPVRAQMGHYRLDTPSLQYDGAGAAYTTAIGTDILDMLDAMVLPETFYTPKWGNVVQDIRVLLAMATRGMVGVNLVKNASFEASDTNGNLLNWANNGTWGNGGAGTVSWSTGTYDYPSGTRAWGPRFDAAQPAGALAQVRQDIPIPASLIGQRVWVSGMWLPAHADHRGYLLVNFFDASSTLIPYASFSTPARQRPPLRWTREQAYGVIPENTATIRVTCVISDAVGNAPDQRRSSWDDITLQTISGEPMPESRMLLPADPVYATSRIQSEAGVSFLTAIDDRWRAAGYQPMFTTMDGRLTTRKDVAGRSSVTPARTYTDDDARIVEQYAIERDSSNRYNTVLAIKEDLQAGVFWSQQAVNENPDDPWNVYGDLGRVVRVITVQDAVDEAALLAAAQAELAQASMQEHLSLGVLPDPGLGLHDLIAMESETRAHGMWSATNLTWGMTEQDPLVQISGRRTIAAGGAS